MSSHAGAWLFEPRQFVNVPVALKYTAPPLNVALLLVNVQLWKVPELAFKVRAPPFPLTALPF